MRAFLSFQLVEVACASLIADLSKVGTEKEKLEGESHSQKEFITSLETGKLKSNQTKHRIGEPQDIIQY